MNAKWVFPEALNKVKNMSYNEMIESWTFNKWLSVMCSWGKIWMSRIRCVAMIVISQTVHFCGKKLDFPKQNLGNVKFIESHPSIWPISWCTSRLPCLAVKTKRMQHHLHLETRSPSCHVLKIQPAVSHTILNPSFQSGISEGIPKHLENIGIWICFLYILKDAKSSPESAMAKFPKPKLLYIGRLPSNFLSLVTSITSG